MTTPTMVATQGLEESQMHRATNCQVSLHIDSCHWWCYCFACVVRLQLVGLLLKVAADAAASFAFMLRCLPAHVACLPPRRECFTTVCVVYDLLLSICSLSFVDCESSGLLLITHCLLLTWGKILQGTQLLSTDGSRIGGTFGQSETMRSGGPSS